MAALSRVEALAAQEKVQSASWIAQHPRVATVGAVAFAALGLALGATAIMATVTLSELLALAGGSALSLSAALYLATVKGEIAKKKIDLVQVMRETLDCLKAGFYTSPDGKRHKLDLQAAADSAALFHSAGAPGKRPGSENTRISVQDKDCLYVASDLDRRGLNPLVLNLGNDDHFGGGYLRGAKAQEEELCRRSGLSYAGDTRYGLLTQDFYPLRRNSPSAGVYISDVPVFRSGAETGYAFLDSPFSVAFGTVAAYYNPPLVNTSKGLRLRDEEANVTREKIRTVLEMALQKGHKSVVLGALGCGAFCNPPAHIVELFMDVIEKEYPDCFQEIVFAVLDDHNTGKAHNPEGNFKPFARHVLKRGGEAFDSHGRSLTKV